MINNIFKISELTGNRATVSWTSPGADYVSFLYVNGYLIQGPILLEVVNRTVSMRFTDTLNKCIEIHEFPVNDLQGNHVCIRENDKPLILWNRKSDAVRYRVFHTPFGGSETKISDQKVFDDREIFTLDCPVSLVEGWHFFRVEAVNQFGVESVHELWRYRAFRIPKPVSDVTIADGSGSGKFDITIS